MKDRLPSRFKQEIPDAAVRGRIQLLSEFKVNTVCSHARCPNLASCFKELKFTFMILGDTCTRSCRFCVINKSGKESLSLDENEPDRISQIARVLKLKFVVVTSVTRDDLPDGGAEHFARTVRLLRGAGKEIKIEVLVPDFSGSHSAIRAVIEAGPSIFAHNIETVKRLYGKLRPEADYERSLGVLGEAKEIDPSIVTKSSLMLGMGETGDEVLYVMQDLRQKGCDILTLGQYLAPSDKHFPVQEFISKEQFEEYRRMGMQLGFKGVLSGPKVRSSYQAEEVFSGLK